MSIGVYKIKCTLNNKAYIGSSINIHKRWAKHKSNLNKNKHINSHLQNSWNKYGISAFEFSIIEENISLNDLLKREQFHIDNCDGELFNIRKIAKSNLGLKMSDETKALMSKKRKEYVLKNPEFINKLKLKMIGNTIGFKKKTNQYI
jgi:group I intron endonuclease